MYTHVPRPPQFPGTQWAHEDRRDIGRQSQNRLKGYKVRVVSFESCPEAASAEPSSPTKIDLEEKR